MIASAKSQTARHREDSCAASRARTYAGHVIDQALAKWARGNNRYRLVHRMAPRLKEPRRSARLRRHHYIFGTSPVPQKSAAGTYLRSHEISATNGQCIWSDKPMTGVDVHSGKFLQRLHSSEGIVARLTQSAPDLANKAGSTSFPSAGDGWLASNHNEGSDHFARSAAEPGGRSAKSAKRISQAAPRRRGVITD